MEAKLKLILLLIPLCFTGCEKTSAVKETAGKVAMKGKPVTLLGNQVKVGDIAPNFEVVGNDMSVVELDSYRGKICIICSVPSLDTPVCDMETRKFNETASELGNNIVVLTISMDLPFAQARWCGAAGVKNLRTLSDYRWADFGQKFGVLIKEVHLLARAVFVLDKEGKIRYIQIVDDASHEPDYQSAIKAAKALL